MIKKWTTRFLTMLLLLAPLAACEPSSESTSSTATDETTTATATSTDSTAPAGSRLEAVKARGKLICGVEGTIPGFSFVATDGSYSGLDVDVCKAVAAAVFGDPEAVEYRNLDSTERFTALRGGEVDMLARNTTWTLSRDATGGNAMEFAPTTFYDAQGMMVRADSGVTSLEDMDGLSICVETGTTTELNLTSRMTELGVTYTDVKFQDGTEAVQAYLEERCDGFTSDKSQLFARRTQFPTPEDHILLDVSMSKEPLGPVTMNNDSQWFDVVKWVTFGLFQAEEFGITQANVDQIASSTDSKDIKAFLGAEGDFGTQLGLENDFMLNAVKAVGNYGEMYDRSIGDGIPRGLNKLWNDGGLMYSPPFR
ncbi:amino acid ABC transporter substrate-binding protein [Prochlorothrix hollandica]|uniref:Amino acid ABC transporter substrate-binding protein n=1 Tax=Prochlorothrix hollandica PCC 9006 = CALU 1027 TaxID=317619 RepID=A0A0M2PX37_PROHO|nr:amino acid ABC transporter substrate-binding protein [Prochlorothrix hollandica]KKI98926.1 amino acid ABC transporter substrate-binding protein [Prochlorothrix hollandica PCC 9006 = CALU 1027]